jgi:hypothetical protein
MSRLKKILLNEYVLVFLFCLAAIHGPAFSLMDNYDQTTCVDCTTYVGLAEGNFDQSPVRRYRPIVPAMAAGVNFVFGRAFNALKPSTFPGNFPLTFSFYLINCLLLSLWGVVIYRYSRAFGLARRWALAGLLVMLSCRWTPYIAGTPIVDSLYCLILGLVLLGIKIKNERLIVLAIFLGPFAKEAFLFVAPVIFLFSHVSKWRQVVYFAASGILVFSFRYAFDHYAHLTASGIEADLEIVGYVKETVLRLIGFHGIYDILSNIGLWLIFPLAAFRIPAFREAARQTVDWPIIGFMAAILIHLILNSCHERMFYLTMPLLCLYTGLSFRELTRYYFPAEK